jgi:raffinose/stachyose/melibiose transport system substrate-binding protein
MTRKRMMVVSLILSTMIVITACGTQSGNGNSGNAAQTEQNADTGNKETKTTGKATELVFFGVDLDEQKLSKYWKPFEEQHNVKIKVVTTKSDKFMETFMASHNAKQTIDVLNLNGQDVRYMAVSGMIKDITPVVSGYQDRFNQSALNPYTFEGKVFAIPAGSMATSAIFYNKSLLDKHNLEAPKTLQDFIAVNDVLKKDGVSTISFNGKDIYMWSMWFFQTFAQTSGNKSVERTMDTLRGNAKFTDPDYLGAMKALQEFGKNNLFEPGVNGVDGTASKAIFATGKAAMFYGGSWELDGFQKSAKESGGKLELAVAHFPMVTDQSSIQPQSTGGSGSGIAVSSTIDPKKEELASQFIDFWTSDAVQQQILDDTNGVFAVNLNVKSKKEDPLVKDLTTNYLPQTVTFLDWYWPPEITKAFQQNIQAVVGGQEEPEAAMQDIQKTFDDLVAKGYNFDNKK